MSEDEQKPAEGTVEEAATGELGDEELEAVNGGIALLLPAVQQAREAARDGQVDAADYTVWRQSYGSAATTTTIKVEKK
jgi:hypothetical protein